MKRRPNIIIYMEILGVLREGPRGPTRLSQACGLNYDTVIEFLNLLEGRRLIRKQSEAEHELYSITADGVQLCDDWMKVWNRLGT